MTSASQELLASLRDREYRALFVAERVRSSVALQIRALREQRSMTQKQLGAAIGMAQTWVSTLENPDYGKMTVATLLRLAEAFDTDLEIKFRPFSATIDTLPRQGPDYFQVPSFEDEFGDEGESEVLSEADLTKVLRFIVATRPEDRATEEELLQGAHAHGAADAWISAQSDLAPKMPPMSEYPASASMRLYGSR